MEHIHGTDLPCNGCVMTIGKFEGIHLGHRALIDSTVDRARELGLPSVVLAFEPHPYMVLSKADYMPIYTINERAHLLGQIPGLDYALAYPFTEEFAKITPTEFCRLLFEELMAREVFVGENFGFGFGRYGDADFLERSASAYGAKVRVAKLLHNKDASVGMQISSSNIRNLIEEGKLQEARKQLGYPFFLIAESVVGRKLGRVLGFPTVNVIPPWEKFLPRNGVYHTRIVLAGTRYPSITNIGINPTVSTARLRTVETHVLNPPELLLSKDYYGQQVILECMDFLRPEKKFESVDALIRQINIDIHKLGLQNLNDTVNIDK